VLGHIPKSFVLISNPELMPDTLQWLLPCLSDVGHIGPWRHTRDNRAVGDPVSKAESLRNISERRRHDDNDSRDNQQTRRLEDLCRYLDSIVVSWDCFLSHVSL
jgi:predicted acyl esterase